MFILRALEKILSDKDIKKSYLSLLRKTCESSLSKFYLNFRILTQNKYILYLCHYHITFLM